MRQDILTSFGPVPHLLMPNGQRLSQVQRGSLFYLRVKKCIARRSRGKNIEENEPVCVVNVIKQKQTKGAETQTTWPPLRYQVNPRNMGDLTGFYHHNPFCALAEPEDEENITEEVDPEAGREIETVPMPCPPCEAERNRHNLTHVPYAKWCSTCVKARALDRPHRQQKNPEGVPVIQWDYTHLRTDHPQDALMPILVGISCRTGYGYAGLPSGKTIAYSKDLAGEVLEWMREAGIQGKVRMRSDGEPSIMAMLRIVAAKRALWADDKDQEMTIIEQTPVKSSSSLGAAERFAATIGGITRTLRQSLIDRHGIALRATSGAFQWMISHAAYVYNRCQVRMNGLTPYEEVQGRRHRDPMFQFGQAVLVRTPRAKLQPKLEARFLPGLWLGKKAATGEHRVAIAGDRILCGRSCRPLAQDSVDFEKTMKLWDVWAHEVRVQVEIIEDKDKEQEQSMPDRHPEMERNLVYPDGRRKKRPSEKEAAQRPTRRGGVVRGEAMEAAAEDEAEDAEMSDQIEEEFEQDQSLEMNAERLQRPRGDDEEDDQPRRRVRQKMKRPPGMKRPRDQEQEEALDQEEYEARGDLSLITINGPPWYDEYTGDELPDSEVQEAMANEKQSLQKHDTYHKVKEEEKDVPGTEMVHTRWLLHRKPSTHKVKARLVAQQVRYGRDELDTYAATASMTGLRLLIALMLLNRQHGEDWCLFLGDVKVAFPHASLPLDRRVILQPPPTDAEPGWLWMASKALYGLRESPRLFQEWLSETVGRHGWQRMKLDPMLYFHAETGAIMSVWADDMLIALRRSDMQKIQQTIDEEIDVKWGPEITKHEWSRYLGKEWRLCGDDQLVVRMPTSYWSELLTEWDLADCRAVSTPGEVGSDKPEDEMVQLDVQRHHQYRRAVGKVLYASHVRPDITFVVKELARHVSQPTVTQWLQLRRLLRYIKGTSDMVLTLTGHDAEEFYDVQGRPYVVAFADANWAAGPDRKSTSGGCVMYGGVLLNSWARTQQCVALSTAESELIALGVATQEAQLAQHTLQELGVPAEVRLYSGSLAARAVCAKRGAGRMKHVAVQQLRLQDEVRENRIQIRRVETVLNLADLFTKLFAGPRHSWLSTAIGLCRWTGEQAEAGGGVALIATGAEIVLDEYRKREETKAILARTQNDDVGPIMYHGIKDRKDPCGVRCFIGVMQNSQRGTQTGHA